MCCNCSWAPLISLQGHLSGGVDINIRGAAYIVAAAQPPGCRGGAPLPGCCDHAFALSSVLAHASCGCAPLQIRPDPPFAASLLMGCTLQMCATVQYLLRLYSICADAERTLFVEEHHWLFIHDQREKLRYVYAIPAARNTTDLGQVLHVRFILSPCPAMPVDMCVESSSCTSHRVHDSLAGNASSNWEMLWG